MLRYLWNTLVNECGYTGSGNGSRWIAKGGYTLEQKSSCCLLTEVQKGPQCICNAKTVVNSSFREKQSLNLLNTPIFAACGGLEDPAAIYQSLSTIFVHNYDIFNDEYDVYYTPLP